MIRPFGEDTHCWSCGSPDTVPTKCPGDNGRHHHGLAHAPPTVPAEKRHHGFLALCANPQCHRDLAIKWDLAHANALQPATIQKK